MSRAWSLRAIVDGGVPVTFQEAVAIVQQLISLQDDGAALTPPFGPPSLDNIYLSELGSIECRSSCATPAVSEAARLLDALLAQCTGTRVPGSLRYAIARALLEVDAPPFDSIDALAATLARYEHEPRSIVLLRLAARTIAKTSGEAEPVGTDGERHRAVPSSVEGDRPSGDAGVVPIAPATGTWLLSGAVAACVAFGVGYVMGPHLDPSSLARPPLPSVSWSAIAAAPSATPSLVKARKRATEEEARPMVRAVDAGAGPVFSPSFASDGSALFFHAGGSSGPRSALEAAAIDGDDLRVMTIVDDGAKNYHVQPSPDGTRVAFDSDRDGVRGVYVANRNGTDVHRVSGPGYAAVPTWSPDGETLAFVRDEPQHPAVWNLWLLNLQSGEMRRLTAFRFGQTWSGSWFPGGKRIAYTHEDRLILRDLDHDTMVQYASPVAGRLVRTAAVSPDGEHVIFQVAQTGAYLLDLRDGSMRCVLADPTAEEFAWSPDGHRVAFHSRRDGQWAIWIMDHAAT
ncbi:MAG TPA: hypothetical protein VFP91_10745 [Vicinamibacterales bacterium]|nr:hypothetical protein [Vicinamibacterales bacterium]